MTGHATPRWILSFADLCLVLLGFFVTLYATGADPARVSASLRDSFGEEAEGASQSFAAAQLFEPGEAVLRPKARAVLAAAGKRAGKGRVSLVSRGTTPGSARLDGWELAAARTGAVARALRSGGLSEDRIGIILAPGTDPQTIDLMTIR
ncbi:flagellar motor protein MotB [Sphingomonas sp. 1P06PA]|uniref:OmpA/MotB family protein n=1 Tax=Sphingomonas sp. 1P06PA TaxID=554121 RepID=UPI0039A6618F